MKKIYIAIALAGVLSAPSLQAAFDGTIGISDTTGRIGTGGPFTVQVLSSSSAALNAVIGRGNPFLSFCVEMTETVNLGGNQGYQVNVNTAAVNGGPIIGGNPDPLSLATAWLYSTFRSSGNTGLDAIFIANAAGANNAAKIYQGRNDLQQAIWYLEHEQSPGNNYLVTAAINQLAAGGYGTTAANVRSQNANGAFETRVLNVLTSDGLTKLQDQLALVPEPSTYFAGALLLIPVLIQIRRWKRSAS